jgi:hypothetical protein
MGDLLGSLVWGAKSGQYCVIGGRSLQMVSEPPSNARSCGTGALYDVALTGTSGV